MADWLHDALLLAENGVPFELVTVVGERGSAPRETGARMLVTASETLGSIGGGQLEYRAAGTACRRLADAASPPVAVRRFVLGADLGQCCGGVVDIEFRRVAGPVPEWLSTAGRLSASGQPFVLASTIGGNDGPRVSADAGARPPDGMTPYVEDGALVEPLGHAGTPLALYGAGHVGTALVRVLGSLDFDVHWFDSRPKVFPEALPANVAPRTLGAPGESVRDMPAGAFFVVMTHSHALDLALCTEILARDDFAYCGLIGSRSKRRRFERRFRDAGIGEAAIERLTCPVGAAGITGKKPAEIAIAVGAELLALRDALRAAAGDAVLRALA